MRNVLIYSLSLCCLLNLTGCSTMGSMAKKEVPKLRLETKPDGATVTINNTKTTSPVVFALKNKKEYEISIEKDGYKTVIMHLKPKLKGDDVGASFLSNTAAFGWWTLGIGTAVGMLVDSASGSLVNYEDGSLLVELEPGEGTIEIGSSSVVEKEE